MGFPSGLFTSKPDDNFLCVICHEILEDASSLECGHSFCEDCIQSSLRLKNKCPACRKTGVKSSVSANFPLRGLVLNLEIGCKHNDNNDDCSWSDEPPQKQQRIEENKEETNGGKTIATSGTSASASPQQPRCPWIGRLGDWPAHSRTDCQLHLVPCEWCDHRCTPRQMTRHMAENASAHMHNLKQQMQQQFDAQLNQALATVSARCEDLERKNQALEETVAKQKDSKPEKEMVHLHITSFCRQWMARRHRRPDVLKDFVCYRPRTNGAPVERLLFGIPGPGNTPWEGGLFPMLMMWKWGIAQPPTCCFQEGFHHVNVYPSGTIASAHLYQDEAWHPELSIFELLFIIQQFIAHPNPDSPAQSAAYDCIIKSKSEYDAKARALAAENKNDDSFLEPCAFVVFLQRRCRFAGNSQ